MYVLMDVLGRCQKKHDRSSMCYATNSFQENIALRDVKKMRVASKVWFSVVVRCACLFPRFFSGCASVAGCAML